MSNRLQKEKKLIKNTIWYFMGSFSSKAISFLLVPLYTSILTTAEYSISDIISTTVSLSLPFFTLIISSAVFRFVLDKKGNYDKIFTLGFSTVIIGFIPLAIISFVVFMCIDTLRNYWLYFVLYYILSAIATLESEFLKGQEKVKTVALVGFIYTVVVIGLNILFLVVLKMRIEGYLIAHLISSGVSVIMYAILGKTHRYIIDPRKIGPDLRKEMYKYSIPMIPNSAMWWITNSSDRYFVSAMVSISANGLLSVSYKIPSLLAVFISIFHSAWELSVVEDFEKDSGKAFFNEIYQKYIEFNIIITAFLVITSKLLGSFLYASDFFEAWKYSAILVVGYSFHSMAGFLGTVFTTVKKTKLLFISTFIGAGSNLILNFVLINFFGIIGAVIATVVSYFLTFAVRLIGAKKLITLTTKLTKNVLSFCLIIVEAILVFFDTFYGFIVAGIIFAALIVVNRAFFTYVFNIIFTMLKKLIKRRSEK